MRVLSAPTLPYMAPQPLHCGIFMSGINELDEDEYEIYLNAVFGMEEETKAFKDQLRDEDGYLVPGCYHVSPAPTE